jgi:protein O-GlcNAc transferase
MGGLNVINTSPAQAQLLENARDQLVAGQFVEAESLYRQYLKLHPPHAETCFNLGLALHRQGNLAEAIGFYQQTINILPSLVDAHQNLGYALHTLTMLDEAESSYRRAIKLKPQQAELHNNLGNVLKDMGQLDKAVACYEQALTLNPQYPMAYNNLGNAFKDLGMLDEAVASYQKALEFDPQQIDSLGNLLFVLSYHPSCPPEQYLAVAQEFGDRVATLAKPYSQWNASAVKVSQALRVGLVSGDMRTHPVGFFLENIIRHIDANKLILVAYTTKPHEDDLTARIKPCFAEWYSLVGLSDEAAAQKIHADGIHILIDLAGHTAHNRLPIFAWKPAPVQITWLGYFASTGVAQMDVLLADSISVPETHQPHFTETIHTLPDTRLCFTPPAGILPISPLPATKNGTITFGCFQNMSKFNGRMLASWARILQDCPTPNYDCKTTRSNLFLLPSY